MNSILILCKNAPFGSNSGMETIRLGAGFMALGEEIECKILFYQAGILNLVQNLASEKIGMDSQDDGLEMADLAEVPIAVVREDLADLGLSETDLMEYEALSIISRAEIPSLLQEFPTVFHI